MDTYVAVADEDAAGERSGNVPPITSLLPSGFPFLVDADTGEIIEATLLFLRHRHLPLHRASKHQRWVKNTVFAQAHDLNDWWKFIGAHGLAWDVIGHDDVRAYVEAMMSSVSPHTHQPLSRASIRRRVGTLLTFYKWAYERKLFATDVDQRSEVWRKLKTDYDALAHTRCTSLTRTKSELMPSKNQADDEHVHPFSRRDLEAVLEELSGSQNLTDEFAHTRGRLAAELALNTGMRVDEVASLRAHQILGLESSADVDGNPVLPLSLIKTKGLVPRTVYIPAWLVNALIEYIKGERSRALSKARRNGLSTNAQGLFLNGATARAHVGKNVRAATLQHEFRQAVLGCGLVHRASKVNPETGEHYVGERPRHSFHDLRHTFAVWTYLARREQGDAEPWKFIQARLGHRHLSTTMSIYLRVVGEMEHTASDHMASFYRSLRP